MRMLFVTGIEWSQLVITDLYQHRICRLFEDNESVDAIKSKLDEIYA